MKNKGSSWVSMLLALCTLLVGSFWSVPARTGEPPPLSSPSAIPGLQVTRDYGGICPRVPPITVTLQGGQRKILLLPSAHEGQLKDYPSPVPPPMSSGGRGGNALRWERLTRACGNFNLVVALDEATCKPEWKCVAGGLVERAFLAEGNKILIFSSSDDSIRAVNVLTGALVWRKDLGKGIEAMLVDDSAVVAVTAGNVALALSPSDGKELWRQGVKVVHAGQSWGWLALKDGVAYLASDDNRVLAVNAHSGELRWTLPTSANPSIRCVQGGNLIVTAGDTVIAAAEDSGAVVWRRKLESVTHAGPVFEAGSVLAATGASLMGVRIFGLDPKTGAPNWMRKIHEAAPMRTGSRVSVPEDVISIPALQLLSGVGDQGPVLLETDREGTRAVEATTGKVIWDLAAKLPWRIWMKGNVLFVNYDSAGEALLCIDAKSGKRIWAYTAPSRIHQLEGIGDSVLVTLWKRQLLVLSRADGKKIGWYQLGDPYRLLGTDDSHVVLCSQRGVWELGVAAPPRKDAPKPPEPATPDQPATPSSEKTEGA